MSFKTYLVLMWGAVLMSCVGGVALCQFDWEVVAWSCFGIGLACLLLAGVLVSIAMLKEGE